MNAQFSGYLEGMSKAFVKDTDDDEEPDSPSPRLAPERNCMTPTGFAALQKELRFLMQEERPRIVEIVSWAASLGDRSENGDYIYNKKRLREIDRRLRYLTKRLETAEVADPKLQQGLDRVFFGATVTYAREDDSEHTVTLVGVDEANIDLGKINWTSPVARALLKAQVGDVVELRTAGRSEKLEILAIAYRIDPDL